MSGWLALIWTFLSQFTTTMLDMSPTSSVYKTLMRQRRSSVFSRAFVPRFTRTDGECIVGVNCAVTDWLASIHSGAPALSTQPQTVVSAHIIAAAIKEHQEGSTTEDESDRDQVEVWFVLHFWILFYGGLTVYAWLRNGDYSVLYWSDSKWQWKYTSVMIEGEGSISQYIVLIAYIAALLYWIHSYMLDYGYYGVLWILCLLLYWLYIGYLLMELWVLQRLYSAILPSNFFLMYLHWHQEWPSASSTGDIMRHASWE